MRCEIYANEKLQYARGGYEICAFVNQQKRRRKNNIHEKNVFFCKIYIIVFCHTIVLCFKDKNTYFA